MNLEDRQSKLLSYLVRRGVITMNDGLTEIQVRSALEGFATLESGVVRLAMNDIDADLAEQSRIWRERSSEDPTGLPKSDGIELARTRVKDYRWGQPADPEGSSR